MTIKPGFAVFFPRTPYGRQHELLALITRVIDAEKGVVDLVAFPVNSEALHLNNVIRQSETVRIHCWAPVASDGVASDEQIAALANRFAVLEGELAMANAAIADLRSRVATLEELATDPRSDTIAALIERIVALESRPARGRKAGDELPLAADKKAAEEA
jgi:hypothetical protein